MIILNALMLILIFIIAPFLTGLIPCCLVVRQRRTLLFSYISGIILDLALFQLIAVPVVFLDGHGFGKITVIYSIALGLLVAAGCVLALLSKKKHGGFWGDLGLNWNHTREEIVEWVIMFAIILFQIIMFVCMSSFDGDDAYYVVESLLSYETGTLYRIRPYTGLSTGVDLRHSLAVLPIWIAYVAKVSGIHPTILSHSILGVLFIVAIYAVYIGTGACLLRKEKNKLPLFMIFIALMQMFGNVSIYTNSTFMLTRTWQGKALLANMVIPAAFWLILNIFDSEKYENDNKFGFWMILFANNILAAMCSTTSVLLMAMVVGITGLVLTIREKDLQILLKLIVTCIPLVAYGCIYLLV